MKNKPTEKTTDGVRSGTNGTDGMHEFVTKKELASVLMVSVRTIENWLRIGILPVIRVGKILRFDKAEVVQHLKLNFRDNKRGVPTPRPENPKL